MSRARDSETDDGVVLITNRRLRLLLLLLPRASSLSIMERSSLRPPSALGFPPFGALHGPARQPSLHTSFTERRRSSATPPHSPAPQTVPYSPPRRASTSFGPASPFSSPLVLLQLRHHQQCREKTMAKEVKRSDLLNDHHRRATPPTSSPSIVPPSRRGLPHYHRRCRIASSFCAAAAVADAAEDEAVRGSCSDAR